MLKIVSFKIAISPTVFFVWAYFYLYSVISTYTLDRIVYVLSAKMHHESLSLYTRFEVAFYSDILNRAKRCGLLAINHCKTDACMDIQSTKEIR